MSSQILSIPGFPAPHVRLSFCGNVHWTNHFFETPSSERYFSKLLGSSNIAPFRPVSGRTPTEEQREGLTKALRNALLGPASDGRTVSYCYVDRDGRLRERRTTLCAGRLVCVFKSDSDDSDDTAELTTCILKASASDALIYAITKVLEKTVDDGGQETLLLPRPSESVPMSEGRALFVQVHNPAAFGLESVRVHGEDRLAFDRGRVRPSPDVFPTR